MFDLDDDPFAGLPADPAAIAAQQAADAAAEATQAAAAATRASQPRPGSRRVGDRRYVGIVRRGRAVLAECGHEHTNRDQTSGAGGTSATDCARAIIAGAARPATAEHTANRLRNAWTALTSTAGFTHSAATIAAAKTTAAQAAAAYLSAVATVRTLTD